MVRVRFSVKDEVRVNANTFNYVSVKRSFGQVYKIRLFHKYQLNQGSTKSP